jgi:MFS family permease
VRKLLFLVCAVVLVDTMFYAGLSPLLPRLSEQFGLGKTGAGVLTGAYALGACCGGIPAGIFTARVGVKPAVLVGLAALAGTSIAFGAAESVAALDVTRFLQGVGSSFTWIGGLTWLVERTPRERRGEIIGIAMSGAVVGALLGPALGGLASVAGRGPTFSGIACLAGALGVVALTLPGAEPAGRHPIGAAFRALRRPPVPAGLWFSVLPGILYGILSVLGPLRLQEVGYGALAIGGIFVLSGALEATLTPIMGRVSDRRGRLGPLRLALSLGTGLSLALAVPALESHWGLPILIAVAGLAYGMFWAPGMALLSDSVESAGLIYAYGFMLVELAWSPGNALGSVLGGSLAQAWGDAVPYLVAAALCMGTLVLMHRRRAAFGPVRAADAAES